MINTLRSYSIEISLIVALAASVGFFGYLGYGLIEPPADELTFSGDRALVRVQQQLEFGPRAPGSPGHKEMGDWLIEQLTELNWEVYIQRFNPVEDVEGRNFMAVSGQGPTVIIAAHYDTRMLADNDPDPVLRGNPVPGANDGGSGVAVLLELARTVNVAQTNRTVCLVFFDAEDNGRIPGWDWILGSRYFVSKLSALPRCSDPEMAVIVDMVGDADQQIRREQNGTERLNDAIWSLASELDTDEWIIDEQGFSLIDDHRPFLDAGIPAITIIDFDYPYWHTTADTLDKVSNESLERVGRLLEIWLERGAPW